MKTERLTRALNSRAARKFRRSRLAMLAMAVILVYVSIGLWLSAADVFADLTGNRGFDDGRTTLFTAFTLDRVDARVGPLRARGWLEAPTGEDRARNIKYYLDRFSKALRLSDPAERREALESLRFAERRAAVTGSEQSIANLQADVSAISAGYRELDAFEDLDTAPQAVPILDRLEQQVDALFMPLTGWERGVYTFRLAFGTDRQGRSISARALYSIKVALQIGVIVGLVSVLAGALLGAVAGYFSGWADQAVQWLYSTLSSVPDLVLLAVLAYMFTGTLFDDPSRPFISLIPVYAAMCMTFWIGPCRVIRGEVMKIKELEYAQAATVIGFSRSYILLRHVLPNTMHLMFINFSLLFIAAIKFEVVLSFLNLGVKAGPSWGRMISESTQEVINGNFWQISAATLLMFFLVLAFNIVSDALQDAFDPKHVG